MKVKIRDQWYDAVNEPIMILTTKEERDQIGSMPEDAVGKYCQAPDTFSEEEIRAFMESTSG